RKSLLSINTVLICVPCILLWFVLDHSNTFYMDLLTAATMMSVAALLTRVPAYQRLVVLNKGARRWAPVVASAFCALTVIDGSYSIYQFSRAGGDAESIGFSHGCLKAVMVRNTPLRKTLPLREEGLSTPEEAVGLQLPAYKVSLEPTKEIHRLQLPAWP